jgi:hypothetical protein
MNAALLAAPVDDAAALGDEIACLAAHLDAATHRLLTCIRRFDESAEWHRQGALSCAHWLTWRINLDPGTAREKVRVARALAHLPALDGALRRGQLSYAKLRALTRVATPENEATLLTMAMHTTGAQLERLCRKLRRVTADDETGDPTDDRRFLREEVLDSGLVRVTVVLHPDEAALVSKAVEQARRPEPGASAEAPAPLPPPDALVKVAESYLAHREAAAPSAPRTEIVVHVDQDPLAADGTLAATLDDGTRVSAETFRRLCCDATLVTALHAAGDRAPTMGQRTRTISRSLRRALLLRDGGCRFPACTNRLFLHAHHIQHWVHGGPTTADNLVVLCSTHHRLVHEGGLRVERTCDGHLRFKDRAGRPIDSVAAAWRVVGEAAATLSARNENAGVHVVPETNLSGWDGENVDYEEAVAAVISDSAHA